MILAGWILVVVIVNIHAWRFFLALDMMDWPTVDGRSTHTSHPVTETIDKTQLLDDSNRKKE